MRVLTDDKNYENIADAIREKLNTTASYKPAEMAEAIKNIPTGGGGGGGGGGLIPIETRELALNFAPPPEGAIVDRLDWNAPSGYGYKNVFIKRPESLRQDTVKAGEVIFGVVGTYSGGGGDDDKPADPIDPKQYYRENRNPNYPYIPLPSEIIDSSDIIYLLFDANSFLCFPIFYCVGDNLNAEIIKYKNKNAIETENIQINSNQVYSLKYEKENIDEYNYILIKIKGNINECNIALAKENIYRSSDLIEFSGKCKNCILSNNGISSEDRIVTYRLTRIEYFSCDGFESECSRLFENSYNLKALVEINDYFFPSSCNDYFSGSGIVALPNNKNIFSKVVSASAMFKSCKCLKSMYDYNFDSLTNANFMFDSCYLLEKINLEAPLLENGQYLATETYNLKYFKLHTETEIYGGCRYMLNDSGIREIESVIIPNWTNYDALFRWCPNLRRIKELKLGTGLKKNGQKVDLSFNSLFAMSSLLEEIPENSFLNFEDFDTISCANMFTGTKIKKIFDINYNAITNAKEMYQNCTKIKEVSNISLSNAYDSTGMFQGCVNLVKVQNLSVPNITNLFQDCTSLLYVDNLKIIDTGFSTIPRNGNNAFYNCSSLIKIPNINFELLDEGAAYMFYKCTSLSGFDKLTLYKNSTSMSKDFSHMFDGCTNLKKINKIYGPGIDQTNFSYLFYNSYLTECPSLYNMRDISAAFQYNLFKDIDIDLLNIEYLNSLFSNSSLVETATIRISNYTSASRLFYNCRKLKKVVINNYTASTVNVFKQAFYNCSALTTVVFQTMGDNHLFGTQMFNGIIKTQLKIYVPDEKVTSMKTEIGWKDYADIILPLSSYTDE